MLCWRAQVMPRGHADRRARTYSLYAATGIVADRDSPVALEGFPGQCGVNLRIAPQGPLIAEGVHRVDKP